MEGSTIDALMRDFELQESVRSSVLKAEHANAITDIQDQRRGVEANANQRIGAATPQYQQVPSLLGMAI